MFIQKVLKSAGAGLLIAALLFYAFPRLSPGYAAATASACFLMFGLVVLRPIARSPRFEDSAGTVIVGSEEMARRLYNEIIEREAPENVRIVAYDDLFGRFAQEENISRVVVADLHIQNETPAAQTLIDLKLRGIRIETALESF